MIFLLSPAKTLDYESPLPELTASMPSFLDDSEVLASQLAEYAPEQISALMKVSEKIAELNAGRFEQWHKNYTAPKGRPAIFAFKGDVYQGLDVASWNADELASAQSQIRILSGLYGMLRPLDLMLPYRLEMGTKLENERGANLYKFWGSQLTDALNAELAGQSNPAVVNLASNEYYKAIQPKNLQAPIITPVFKDEKNGKFKIISFYAKKARGLMAAWAIRNKITDPAELKNFSEAGYVYDAASSKDGQLVFLRAEQ
ncbi:peroxide stress protein YaaA [Persicirhabdus sediminis]|uniref:UPF0246 protein JIN82_00615 n=1 Tax=Persicirhabdus sediminis TaxID=454144 RepID=A0A8J7MA11_9BACT|nr:peroxide stress protein YaaA [Persicirhabdus sediminis]MBK1789647.1 peroxide stress protein YaaA [Persicirhabdus sediminis]